MLWRVLNGTVASCLLQTFPVKVTKDIFVGSHELAVKVVSSANVLDTNYRGQAGRSLIQIRNNRGPRIEPCGTSQVTWENSHRHESHTGKTFWFRVAFTWWLGHFISCYLKVHFMLMKYTCVSKSQTLRTRYSFQSTGRPISHRNGWSFRVYMIPLRDFVPEWNSPPGTRTGVNSPRGDSRRHGILWWYHVNKYRAMRGNRSELAPGRKSPRCHVTTPL